MSAATRQPGHHAGRASQRLASPLIDDCLNSVAAIKLAVGELADPAVTLSDPDRDELLSVISAATDRLTDLLRTPPPAS